MKIVLTGPESTGKTTLAMKLADFFDTFFIAEYAREYVEKLNGRYTYQDVCHIAEKQYILEREAIAKSKKIFFVDTDLIITKIWFDKVFGKIPIGLNKMILENKADFYLLCAPDVDWVYDPVRENPGYKRIELFNIYENELRYYNCKYEIITGNWSVRLTNAINAVNNFFDNNSLNLV